MKFAPLFEKITTTANEAQLRSTFMENAGELVGATAWGFDLLDSRFQVIESDLYGLPNTFRDRYQAMGSGADVLSQQMIRHQIPVHNLSLQSYKDWRQSQLYQRVLLIYGMEHGMVAPLIGNGRLIGGIYFMRGEKLPAFKDSDLIQLSSLCQHLSVRLATLRLPINSQWMDRLTPRELDIVELVAQGLSNRAISQKLYISQDAVKQALKRIFRKIDVSARTEMVAKLKGVV
ncbi:MAG: LuxR C-terminal-related transcriptional regulator [Leptolyngbyaceae cyanobacterium MO_188.B28]|nr:LuxR C-terminal-related transcriptional regulator [Leptolyngbyaceae cyanobacterium MO_188.B28]